MLIDKDSKPEHSIFYISCCILEEIKEISFYDMEELFNLIQNKYCNILDYSTYIMAINFLYLIEKIGLDNGRLKYVH